MLSFTLLSFCIYHLFIKLKITSKAEILNLREGSSQASSKNPSPQKVRASEMQNYMYSFKNYILLIMLLLLSQFFPLCSPHQEPLTSSGNPHPFIHVHGSCMQVPWLLHFLYSTLHPQGYSVTIDCTS